MRKTPGHAAPFAIAVALLAACSGGDPNENGETGDTSIDADGGDVGIDETDGGADTDTGEDPTSDADTRGDADSSDVADGSGDADAACPDADGDSVCDASDVCADGDDRIDSDGDSVPDVCDVCAGYPDDLDNDGDGTPNGCDTCDATEPDADSDGTPDACDVCADGDDAVDTDDDGTPDACDACPADADKVAPGLCGCGVADDDTDSDGTPDCDDECPEDGGNDNERSPTRLDCAFGESSDGERVFVDHDRLCDGVPDCDDPALGATDEGAFCAPGGVECTDGSTITLTQVCDGVVDCSGAEDESDRCDAPQSEGDGVCAADDNCPGVYNPGQEDADDDGAGDACDRCPGDDRTDADGDTVPDCIDVCDSEDDTVDDDADGVPDCVDSCPDDSGNDVEPAEPEFDCSVSQGAAREYIPAWAICDGDVDCVSGVAGGNIDERCDLILSYCDAGNRYFTVEQSCDGVADCEDGADETQVCRLSDAVGDGICSADDNCPLRSNPDQADEDADGFGDACDVCRGADDAADEDSDSVPDCLDQCSADDDTVDLDADGYPDCADSCPGDPFNDLERLDTRYFDCRIGDTTIEPTWVPLSARCDGVQDCPPLPGGGSVDEFCANEIRCGGSARVSASQVCDDVVDCPGALDEAVCTTQTTFGDGLCGDVDNCPAALNEDQADEDGDGVGDACDLYPGEDDRADEDLDGVLDRFDVCPGDDDLLDRDRDGIRDCQDDCLNDPLNDADTEVTFDCNLYSGQPPQYILQSQLCDGVVDCPDAGLGPNIDEACDGQFVLGRFLCGESVTLDQYCDGVGHCLDAFDETICGPLAPPGDGYCYELDNCPLNLNADQADDDGDGVGDACDICPGEDDQADEDGDTVPDCLEV